MKNINSLTIMGQKLNTFALLAAVAGLWLAVPSTLHAQNLILEKVSLSATIYEQNTNTADNEVTFTTKAPTKVGRKVFYDARAGHAALFDKPKSPPPQ